MHIERHVFGSFKGYATLARSSGITSDDCKLLEGLSFGFGQTSDKRYLKSLASEPAFFTRVLRNGRRGLTRIFDGGPDDNGRPTLRMITAVVVQREWDTEIAGDLNILLSDPRIWRWQLGSEIAALAKAAEAPDATTPRKSARKIAELITQVERCVKGSTCLIVGSDDFDGEQIRGVEMLIPPSLRAQFTSAYRSLSPQLNVMLNCLAPEAPTQKLGYRHDPNAPLSDYARFLLDRGLELGTLPIADLLSYRPARAPGSSVTPSYAQQTPPPPPPIPKSRLPVMAIAAVFTAFIVAFVLGYLVGTKRSQPTMVVVTPSATQPTTSVTPPNSIPARPPLANTVVPSTAPVQGAQAGADSNQAALQRIPSSTASEQNAAAGSSMPPEPKMQTAITTTAPTSQSALPADRPTSQAVTNESTITQKPLTANPSTSAAPATRTASVAIPSKDIALVATSLPSTRGFASVKNEYEKLLQSVRAKKVFDLSEMATFQKASTDISNASALNLPKDEEKWVEENKQGIISLNSVIKSMYLVEQALHQCWMARIEGNGQVKQREAELKSEQEKLKEAINHARNDLKVPSLAFPIANELNDAVDNALKKK